MEALLAELRSPRDAAMMNIVLADSVYTPTRACIRGVAGGGGGEKGVAGCVGLHKAIGCTISNTVHTPLDRKVDTGLSPVHWQCPGRLAAEARKS